jgi:hypothetical protein
MHYSHLCVNRISLHIDSLTGKYYPSAMSDAITEPSPTIVPLPMRGVATRLTSERVKAMWEVRRAKASLKANPVIILQNQQPLDPFTAEQRDVIRSRMKRLTDKLDTEEDPSKLDRLAAAWSKLAEQERILDGRPLPGSRRPREERRSARPSLPEPE